MVVVIYSFVGVVGVFFFFELGRVDFFLFVVEYDGFVVVFGGGE